MHASHNAAVSLLQDKAICRGAYFGRADVL